MPMILNILSKIINNIHSKNKKYLEDISPFECTFHPKINCSRMTTVITIFSYENKTNLTCNAYYGRAVIKQAAIRATEQPSGGTDRFNVGAANSNPICSVTLCLYYTV